MTPLPNPIEVTRLPTMAFVGSGRLASGLALALSQRGASVVAVSSRRLEAAEQLACRLPRCKAVTSAQDAVDAAELVFLAVPDDAVAAVVSSLRWREGVAVVHCSAATEVSVLAPAAEQGARIGGFHPLQAFGDPEVSAATLPGCSMAIEADGGLRETLESLAALLDCRVIHLPPGSRAQYHAAAHYAAGFVFTLMQEAAQLWQTFGVAPDDAVAALAPLLRGTAAAMQRSGLAGMPGIFGRGDVGTLQKHLAAIATVSHEALHLYGELGLRSVALGQANGGVSEERAVQMRALLQAIRQ